MSSTVQTRRSTTTQEDTSTNHRSLSERIRGLFRKKSSSPGRPSTSDERAPSISSRPSSPSSESVHVSTEAPHLKAPSISWSLGRKKGKVVETTINPTNGKTKIKDSRKTKKKAASTLEISYPVPGSEQQTFIQGQNFVAKTPELARNTMGRTPSTSSYETTTKGFRDYTIKDSPKVSHQIVVPNIDVTNRTSYTSNRSRSPSTTRQYDSSPTPISDSELVNALQQHQQDTNSSFTSTQVVVPPSRYTNDSNQWKKTSSSSLNKSEVAVDVPKLRTPSVPFGSTSSKKENKRVNFQSNMNEIYHSSPTVNIVTQSNRPYLNTYGSLPDAEILNNGSVTSFKSTKPSTLKYPGLSAILEHHFRPTTLYPIERPHRTTRYDTSTTTISDSDLPQQWSTHNSVRSTSSARQHDGFIRPITPQTFVDDRSSSYPALESPVIYRSTTIIYTKDKHSYVDGGAIQTWSIQENDENDSNRKAFASIQMERQRQEQLSKINTNGFQHSPRSYEQEEENQYNNQNYHFTRPVSLIDKDDAYIQESFHRDNSEGSLHRYNVKHNDSYNGLGIIISANADTRLDHRIRDIEPGSPGSRVGLRRNDRIIRVNGVNVVNTDFSGVLILIKQGLMNNNLQFSVIHESALI